MYILKIKRNNYVCYNTTFYINNNNDVNNNSNKRFFSYKFLYFVFI